MQATIVFMMKTGTARRSLVSRQEKGGHTSEAVPAQRWHCTHLYYIPQFQASGCHIRQTYTWQLSLGQAIISKHEKFSYFVGRRQTMKKQTSATAQRGMMRDVQGVYGTNNRVCEWVALGPGVRLDRLKFM